MKSLIKPLFAIALLFAASAAIANTNVKAKIYNTDGKYYVVLTDNNDIPFSSNSISGKGKFKNTEGATKKIKVEKLGNALHLNGLEGDFKKVDLTLIQHEPNYYFYIKFYTSEQTENIYSCTMHPEQVSNKEGICSNCGMALKPFPHIVATKVTIHNPAGIVHKGSR